MALYESDKTVIDEYWDEFPTLTQTEVRSALGAFLFSQEDVFKPVNVLSGGRRCGWPCASCCGTGPTS
jgi:ATP-binding cassette subfamily F protein 3